jgi:hypothetical protein
VTGRITARKRRDRGAARLGWDRELIGRIDLARDRAGCDFSGSDIFNGLNAEGSQLRQTSFAEADLTGANLDGAETKGAIFCSEDANFCDTSNHCVQWPALMAEGKSSLAPYHEYVRQRGDLTTLYATLSAAFPIERVLYPGSYIDLGPSFVFPDVTYVDTDRRAKAFFADAMGLQAFVTPHARYGRRPRIAFHHADYTTDLDEAEASFDLLISLYAGFVSPPCSRYLKPGGWLLANDSHGDASMARLDPAYDFVAAVHHRSGRYRLDTDRLSAYFVPSRPGAVPAESLREMGRGIRYKKPATAYVFRRRG